MKPPLREKEKKKNTLPVTLPCWQISESPVHSGLPAGRRFRTVVMEADTKGKKKSVQGVVRTYLAGNTVQ